MNPQSEFLKNFIFGSILKAPGPELVFGIKISL